MLLPPAAETRIMLVTKKNFDRIYDGLLPASRLVVDTETTGLQVHKGDRVCGVAIRLPDLKTKPYYFPVRHEGGGNLKDRHYNRLIEELLSRPEVTYTGWNYKFDIKMLMADGMAMPPLAEDVMLAAHLLNENENKGGATYMLKKWSCVYTDPDANKAELALINLLADQGLGKGDMWRLAAWEVEDYATGDVDLTEKARRFCKPLLLDWHLWRIWKEVNQYMLATTRMEQRGIKLNVPLIRRYIKEADEMAEVSYKVLAEMAGYDINPRSNPQLQVFLGMASTAHEFLEPFIGKNKAVDALVEYRQWAKVNNTYYRRYLEKMDEAEILYPNIKLHGTISGRPSAEDPNMQAVPRKSKVYKVKEVLRARKGFLLVSADYSQAELRLTAGVSNDEDMAEMLNAGGDIHQSTADLTGLERDDAKRINFGVVYGIGAPGLSKKIKKSQAQAKEFLDKWHGTFRRVKPTYKEMERQAKRRGYIRLWTGRVRRYFTMRYPEPHKALSNKIQGGISELMRHAITELSRECYEPNGRMHGSHLLLQVHDQILFEVPEDRLEEHVPVIKEVMEKIRHESFRLAPQKVDFKIGKSWGTAEDYVILNGRLLKKDDGTSRQLQRSGNRQKVKVHDRQIGERSDNGARRNGAERRQEASIRRRKKSRVDRGGSRGSPQTGARYYARRDGTVALIPD